MTAPTDAPEFDLRSHLRVLWRRKTAIGLVTLLLVTSAVVASIRQSPLYQGEVRVLLQPATTQSLLGGSSEDATAANRRVNNEIELIKSAPVQAAVRQQLGRHRKVAVSQVGETDVVAVKGQSGTQRRAAAIARAYAMAYIDLRHRQSLDEVNVATRNLQAKIADLQSQIDTLDRQISDAQERAIEQAARDRPTDPGAVLRSAPVAGLTAQRDTLLAQQAPLKQRLDQLQLEASGPGGAQIVSGDVVPVVKVRPHPVRDGVVALVLGLVLGLGLALLLEYLDDSVKSADDLGRTVPGIPVLGMVPNLGTWKNASRPLTIALTDPLSPATEAYKGLRTAMQFLQPQRPPRVFQVTSAKAGEGKTSVVANLGVVLARAGQRVVIVDCDLRRARTHDFFGLPNRVGFTSLFLDQTDMAAAVQEVAGADNLFLLTAGPLPPDPAEVLSSRRTAEVFAELQADFDVVLVDSPPVLPVSDPIALSAWVDATLLVVGVGTTTRRELQRTVDQLRQAEVPIVGLVLNRISADSGYYQYDYGSSQRPSPVPSETTDRVGRGVVGQRRTSLADRRTS